MIAIYRNSFACIRQFWLWYILVAALIAALDFFLPSSTGLATGSFIGLIYFAFALHRHFLFGEGFGPVSGPQAKSLRGASMRFLWISLLLIVGLPVVTLALAFQVLPIPQLATPLATPFLIPIALAAVYWLVLSVFGTALPASAAAEPYGMRLTLTRARLTALDIAGRLLLGPGLFSLTALPLIIVGAVLIAWPYGVQTRMHIPPFALHLSLAGIDMLGRLIGLVNTTLAVAILCDAYRRIQPAPVDTAT